MGSAIYIRKQTYNQKTNAILLKKKTIAADSTWFDSRKKWGINGFCIYFSCFKFQRFSSLKKTPLYLVHHTTELWNISSLRDTLSNGFILQVCYRAANNVWETSGVPPQTTRCHPRRTVKELVNWTSTKPPLSTKTPTFMIIMELLSPSFWR